LDKSKKISGRIYPLKHINFPMDSDKIKMAEFQDVNLNPYYKQRDRGISLLVSHERSNIVIDTLISGVTELSIGSTHAKNILYFLIKKLGLN
jgi:hypothetical protein